MLLNYTTIYLLTVSAIALLNVLMEHTQALYRRIVCDVKVSMTVVRSGNLIIDYVQNLVFLATLSTLMEVEYV